MFEIGNLSPHKKIQEFFESKNVQFVTYSRLSGDLIFLRFSALALRLIIIYLIYKYFDVKFLNDFLISLKQFINSFGYFLNSSVQEIVIYILLFGFITDSLTFLFLKDKVLYWISFNDEGLFIAEGLKIQLITWDGISNLHLKNPSSLSFKVDLAKEQIINLRTFHKPRNDIQLNNLASMSLKLKLDNIENIDFLYQEMLRRTIKNDC